jgi:CBS-domain-containing membrane protein
VATDTAGRMMTEDVTAVTENASFTTIARILADHRAGAVAVLDGDCRVIGVVSEADLLPKEEFTDPGEQPSPFLESSRRRVARRKAAGVIARELMSAPAVTVTALTPGVEAARTLTHSGFRQLPVVDGAGRLVGMLTRANVIAASSAVDRRTLSRDGAAGTAP